MRAPCGDSGLVEPEREQPARHVNALAHERHTCDGRDVLIEHKARREEEEGDDARL